MTQFQAETTSPDEALEVGYVDDERLLPELVAHLREHRSRLRDTWHSESRRPTSSRR